MLRSFFLGLSRNNTVRRWAEHSSAGRRLASRFVAGRTIEDAVEVCRRLNSEGIAVSLDSLGESVTEESEAHAAADIYHRLLDSIGQTGLNTNVSLKLTQMGIDLRSNLAEEIVGGIVEHAKRAGTFVRIDMEDHLYTDATIAMIERLHARTPGYVGAVLQAYLYRTPQDTERLLSQNIRIRLCKGAYDEPAEFAFPHKADVDSNYRKLMKRMVTSGVFCGIATHDEAIIRELLEFARTNNVRPDAFEFQMLYGVRRGLQRAIVKDGFRMRVYVPFGTAWYPYFMRRLAERPANALFLARNLLRK